ncbi:Uncharacterised protein [Streptococcus pneumoniae]|nr:Uncharacterised protein [Streptococcus pneumoniae]
MSFIAQDFDKLNIITVLEGGSIIFVVGKSPIDIMEPIFV